MFQQFSISKLGIDVTNPEDVNRNIELFRSKKITAEQIKEAFAFKESMDNKFIQCK